MRTLRTNDDMSKNSKFDDNLETDSCSEHDSLL